MSVLLNGNLSDYTFLYNGVLMDKVLHNGDIVLWESAIPYTVVFTDYPIEKVSTYNTSDYTCSTTSKHYALSVKGNSSTAMGILNAQVVLPTQKCNRVKIKCEASYDGTLSPGTINGISVDLGSSELIFDCSGEDFTLSVHVTDATQYWLAVIYITEISFYHEL